MFWAGLVLLIIALIAWIVRTTVSHSAAKAAAEGRTRAVTPVAPFTWTAAAITGVAGLLLLLSCLTVVGTKEEGIKTSFGATSGHLLSGLHVKAPWEQVHQMDAAIQTDSYEDGNSDGTCTGIAVRLAFQQTGCASVSIQWRIQPNSGEELYKDYRSFDHVRNALVTRKLTLATNEAFTGYNPLNIAEGNRAKEESLPNIAKVISRIMRREVGGRVQVLSVLLPLITYDPQTQGRINQLQQQVALTRIAQQRKTTNEAEAKANEALAKSVNTSPNVLVSRCLDTLEQMVKSAAVVPAGFSCWPGGGVAGIIAGPKG